MQSVILNRAVTPAGEANVNFYFTRSPYCSSTLRPVADSLANYTFAPLFDVVRQAPVASTSLDRAIDQHALPGLDWLKLDTQGTDLRIFRSARPRVRRRILAVDVEPGLIDAYEGEDLFVDVHRELCNEGFWLSNLNVGGAVRLRPDAIAQLARVNASVDARSVERKARRTPAWCEARYLRTLDSLCRPFADRREFVLLAIFAILDGQWGFAFEAVSEWERIFGVDLASERLKRACAEALADADPSPASRVWRYMPAGLLRAMRRFRLAGFQARSSKRREPA